MAAAIAVSVAGGVVSNLFAKVLELLGKEAVQRAASWWGARDDLKKLKETMEVIQARVDDADRRQEGEISNYTRRCLQRLRLLLYQADDLFDEVVTLDLLKQQQKQQWREKSMLGKVGILFSKSPTISYNRRLANEIKSIRKQIEAFKSDETGFPPVEARPASVQDRSEHLRFLENRETTSKLLNKDVIGREIAQNEIIEMLLHPKEDGKPITVSVIPIVGIGGVGKTTLAQLVLNDQRVRQHFNKTAWAYVPEKEDLIVIERKIFQAFTHENYQNRTRGQVQDGIVKSIKNKRYLLVLDDLWTEGSDITKLMGLLNGGKHGSMVIVTTRNNAVATHFGPDAAYNLETLTDKQSWLMFERLAFRTGQEINDSELRSIGKDIVKMCGNLPLAIEIVAASLSSRYTQSYWLKMKNDLSKAQRAIDNKIMAVLKLSYDHLPLESKPCFAYCSLFPKGYEFEEDDLVRLWLAQGYIGQWDDGKLYFSGLVARNLFQGSEVSGVGDIKKYKMHDLLHDLAQTMAGDESLMLGNESPAQIYSRLVHVNLNGLECPPSLKEASRLRSLLTFDSRAHDVNFFPKFQSLHVLSMIYFEDKKLLDRIRRLIHLRYLKLQGVKIKCLPDSITRLVNLQTLDIKSCRSLKELPADFAKLVNLRHLLLPDGDLTDLPPGFGKLTSLQELNRFIVGEGNGIDSLPALNLKGALVIEFHRWRRDAIGEGKRANLENNRGLTSLKLELGFSEEESARDAAREMNVMLSCLQLPPNLKSLEVRDFQGDEMPVRWLDGLSQLVSLVICYCRKCKVLPKSSALPQLNSLKLYQLDELECVEDEQNFRAGTASYNRCFFPFLEVLEVSYCKKLKGWRRVDGERCQLVFPRLLKMRVCVCPALMSMHPAPKLESLNVSSINWKMVESYVRPNDDKEAASSSSSPPPSSALFTSLKELKMIRVKDGLISLSISSSLCNLSKLEIIGCSELRNLRFESPKSIQKLNLWMCGRLRTISELQHLSGLKELVLQDCEELELKEEEEQEDWKTSRGSNCYLQKLVIADCPKVKSLPPSIQQGLASLKHLHIEGCPDLVKKNMPENEQDWHLIEHIPNILLLDTPNGLKFKRYEDY